MRFSPPLPCIAALLLMLAAPGIAAQSTLVVSPTPGPDVDHADLPAAVAAAAPGDRIELRAGNYTPTTISKGLEIRGRGNVTFADGRLLISAIPFDQQLILRDVDLSGTLREGSATRIEVANCLGPVHLESVSMDLTTQTNFSTAVGVRIRLSVRVSMTRCSVQGASCVSLEVGTATLTDCDLLATASGLLGNSSGVPGLTVGFGSVAAVHGGSFKGSGVSANGGGRAAPGILAQGALRLGGRATTVLAGDAAPGSNGAPAVQAFSSAAVLGGIVIDPDVQLTPSVGSPAVAGPAQIRSVPSARWTSPELLPVPLVTVDGPPNTLYGIVANPPIGALVTELGVLGVDPINLQIVGVGFTNGSGESITALLPANLSPGPLACIQPVFLREFGPRLGIGTVWQYERRPLFGLGN